MMPDPRDPVTYADFQALEARVAALEALFQAKQPPAAASDSAAIALLKQAEADANASQQPPQTGGQPEPKQPS